MTRDTFVQLNILLRDQRREACELAEEAHAITTGKLRDAQRDAEDWDARQRAEIAGLTDDAGKKTFGNDGARAAELLIRQTNSPERQACEDAHTTLSNQIDAIHAHQTRLRTEIAFVENDIQWALTHAADEINEQLATLAAHIDQATHNAAAAAVRHMLADLAAKT
jgi:hypothetical protein